MPVLLNSSCSGEAAAVVHERASRRSNNFNALRFVAASLVLVSHSFELPTGVAQRDFAFTATGRTLSWYAVDMFFVISGYLIFVSWQRKPSLIAFFCARFLRLIPGLFAMLLIIVPILGIAFSTLNFARYLTDLQTARYFLGCLSIIFVKYDLPGVFLSNPLQSVNGSLWTLRYELLCYVSVALAGYAGLFKVQALRRTALFAGITLSSGLLIWLDIKGYDKSSDKIGMAYELARLSMCFQLGSLYSEFEKKIPIKLVVLIGFLAAMAAAVRTPLFAPIANVGTAYITIWLAVVPSGKWIRWTRSAPDYSYGIYIYAFPIQQVLIASMPGISLATMIIIAYPLTLVLAAASWHFIERPSLSLKRLQATVGSRPATSAAASWSGKPKDSRVEHDLSAS